MPQRKHAYTFLFTFENLEVVTRKTLFFKFKNWFWLMSLPAQNCPGAMSIRSKIMSRRDTSAHKFWWFLLHIQNKCWCFFMIRMYLVTYFDIYHNIFYVYETSRSYSLFWLPSIRDIFTTTGRSQSRKVRSNATIPNIKLNYQSISHLLPLH